jgi:hypothetical protein
MLSINDVMPVEMLEMILAHVGRDHYYIVAMVCRQWHAIIITYLHTTNSV